ncbi:MAG: DUF445 domain-containing protein [Acidimicrobiia bacterium]
MALPNETARRQAMRDMQRRATGLLLVMSVVFVVSRYFEARGAGWLSYVRATAEASMVGGLADWFAIVAVFRHPMGIPIPHTAVIQGRKEQIGAGLGEFLQGNFLNGEAVAERIASVSPAVRLAEWAQRPGSAALVARVLAEGLSGTAETLGDAEVEGLLDELVIDRLRALPAGPAVGRILADLRRQDRHQAILDGGLKLFDRFLLDEEQALRARFGKIAPRWLPEAFDRKVFDRVHSGLRAMIADALADPAHELRQNLDRAIDDLVRRLQSDPELQARVDEMKSDLLDHPELRRLAASLWPELKRTLADQAADPASALRSRLENVVTATAARLGTDPGLQAKLDGAVVNLTRYLLDEYADTLSEMIRGMVDRWDGGAVSEQLELLLGRDLQFIRINGTVVGGLIGLLLHVLAKLIG